MTSNHKEIIESIESFLSSYQHDTTKNISSSAKTAQNGLDESTKKALEYIHSMPPAYSVEPSEARKYRTTLFEHAEAANILRQDIKIPCETHELDARVYSTAEKKTSVGPALVYFHGGGFVLGGIESHDKMLAQLCAQSEVDIISVAYRLAPETVFPGAVEDVNNSMKWIFCHTDTLNIDPKRIAIGGDSAGANLATVYCITHKNTRALKPCLQLLIYPSTLGNQTSKSRELFSEKLLLTKTLLTWFHANYISKEQENDPRFQVMNFDDLHNCPPAFIITGGYDPLRDEGQMYVDKLRQCGVTVAHSCYTDMFHGFINFGSLQQPRDAIRECATILRNSTHPTNI